jgi:alcohol dehydrogenase (NADP+)
MLQAKGYATQSATEELKPFSFTRRNPGPNDVLIDILYCGVCHSDLHQVRDEWGNSMYPMVPGHEIVGRVRDVGDAVSKFKVGDLAGVGCLVDACRQCASCHHGLEQYCEEGFVLTYNSLDEDGKTQTFGGYSDCIVVDENFTLKINPKLTLSNVAPLLCAGITTYSPLRHWQAGPGKKVGVMGLGGLGHMAVKIARAMGAEVILFTHSPNKKDEGKRLGAHHVVVTSEPNAFDAWQNQCDLMLNSISADIDLNPYLNCLHREGTLVLLGLPAKPQTLPAQGLIFKRRNIAGSLIGGIAETQEMLDFCANHDIVSDIELIPIDQINQAYERMLKGDVKYRFVIDMASL